MSAYNLLVVAHPDDETIFFSGLLLKLRDFPWHVICATLERGTDRAERFDKACNALGVSHAHWSFNDKFTEHLDIRALTKALQKLQGMRAVFTHNTEGEYGHKHHTDVHRAVKLAFEKTTDIYCVDRTKPDIQLTLSEAQIELRRHILENIYGIGPQNWIRTKLIKPSDGFSKV